MRGRGLGRGALTNPLFHDIGLNDALQLGGLSAMDALLTSRCFTCKGGPAHLRP